MQKALLLEFSGQNPDEVGETVQAARAATEHSFNALILRSTPHRFGYRSSIDIWVVEEDLENARLMLLLAYVVVGHPDWKRARIRLFAYIDQGDSKQEADKLSSIMAQGRLPISRQNLITISSGPDTSLEKEVSRRSSGTDLLISSLTAKELNSEMAEQALLHRFKDANDVLFVTAKGGIAIE